MLFSSYTFIFFFLPAAMAVFFLSARFWGREAAIISLVGMSLFFYGWWDPRYLMLIIGSMVVNYRVGQIIMRSTAASRTKRRWLLAAGIVFNLGLLGYFKYAGFFVSTLNAATGLEAAVPNIVLPLAISFFTFQQIAYLVDVHSREVQEYRLSHYALFVTFFPQLIAGPIVHHREMMPQFDRPRFRLEPRNIVIGLTIFTIGLFKKVVLADGVAVYATPVFTAAATGEPLPFHEAWGGALAYTCQLYFDFSGYSDMAIGAARLFGIRLPINFFSPYKATSIVEFWRRWHITLSRFLRDYLYIPIGGNRKGPLRRYGNLLVTMILGGLWHGAGWTFVVWGMLHGIYLVINNVWDRMVTGLGAQKLAATPLIKYLSWAVTFLAVVVGWVFFRAENMDAALVMLRAMSGVEGVSLPASLAAQFGTGITATLEGIGINLVQGGTRQFVMTYLWVGALLAIALFAPNTAQIMRRYRPVVGRVPKADPRHSIGFAMLERRMTWRPGMLWALMLAGMATLSVLGLSRVSEFLYFQF